MPWLETNPVLERRHFVQDLESGHWSMTELCVRYGISRVTGYKWAERYQQNGVGGLQNHSRAPRSCPHQTPDELVELILKESARYGWGPRKILKRLRTRYPEQSWPARSTVFDILERHGRVQPRHRRRRWKHPGAAPVNTTAPNQIWTVDFKGQFLIYHLGWYRDGEQLAVEVLERIQSEFRESGKDLHLVTMPVSPNNGVHLTRSAPAGRRGPCR